MSEPPKFEHIRHKPPAELTTVRPLIIACSPLRTHANLSTIIRTAGCCGITQVIATGNAKVNPKIARDGAENVTLSAYRSLLPILKKLKLDGYKLVGLEQTTNSTPLADFKFPHKTALVIGSEREGLNQDTLDLLDAVVEISVWGLPYSYNVATATSICIHAYCAQYPTG
ncbi:MAG: TrmH family RNA methyltransferase [Akkermansiaceae bacterium]